MGLTLIAAARSDFVPRRRLQPKIDFPVGVNEDKRGRTENEGGGFIVWRKFFDFRFGKSRTLVNHEKDFFTCFVSHTKACNRAMSSGCVEGKEAAECCLPPVLIVTTIDCLYTYQYVSCSPMWGFPDFNNWDATP